MLESGEESGMLVAEDSEGGGFGHVGVEEWSYRKLTGGLATVCELFKTCESTTGSSRSKLAR